MKKLVLLILILGIHPTHSQTTIPNTSNPYPFTEKIRYKKAIIHFNDGSDIEGIGRLDAIYISQEEVIIFKIEEKDTDEKWTFKDVKGITLISEEEGVKDYIYLKVTKNSSAKIYEVITEGNVTLYKRIKVSKASGITITRTYANVPKDESDQEEKITSSKVRYGVTEEEETQMYYVKRENEPFPTRIKDNYIKTLATYMKDCEVVVEKIKNHEYNFSQLGELVDYYNANCGE